jgi:predicted nucleotidyltransferase
MTAALGRGSSAAHFRPILLQKSKVASVRIFGETLKREAIDDSDNLSRATEVAHEFSTRR